MNRLKDFNLEDIKNPALDKEIKEHTLKLNELMHEMLELNFPDGIHGPAVLAVCMAILRDVAKDLGMNNKNLIRFILKTLEEK